MKKSVKIMLASIMAGILISPGLQAQPEFKSDVKKEYDENGNIIRYDSCWSWSNHNFHFDTEQFQSLMDSAYNLRFNIPDEFLSEIFKNHPMPGFEEFFEDYAFPDLNEFFEGHPFPDFESFFKDHTMPDFEEFFEGHRIPDFEEFFNGMPEFLPGDSIRLYKKGFRSAPGNQKNTPPGIEI